MDFVNYFAWLREICGIYKHVVPREVGATTSSRVATTSLDARDLQIATPVENIKGIITNMPPAAGLIGRCLVAPTFLDMTLISSCAMTLSCYTASNYFLWIPQPLRAVIF